MFQKQVSFEFPAFPVVHQFRQRVMDDVLGSGENHADSGKEGKHPPQTNADDNGKHHVHQGNRSPTPILFRILFFPLFQNRDRHIPHPISQNISPITREMKRIPCGPSEMMKPHVDRIYPVWHPRAGRRRTHHPALRMLCLPARTLFLPSIPLDACLPAC